jgi:hypothetical protein
VTASVASTFDTVGTRTANRQWYANRKPPSTDWRLGTLGVTAGTGPGSPLAGTADLASEPQFRDGLSPRRHSPYSQGDVQQDRMRLGGAPASRVVRAAFISSSAEDGGSGDPQYPGATVAVSPGALHRVLRAGREPALSVHPDPPPLVRTGTDELGPDGELLRVAMDGHAELRSELTTA